VAHVDETPRQRVGDLLLERGAELERAGSAIDRACGGAGEVLVIEGPAGIGKTAFAQAVQESASARGMECLLARGDDLYRDFPYGVVRQLFEAPVREADEHVRDSLLEGAAAPAAAVLGRVAHADSSFAALHALFWLTSNLAERAPLLLAVDDAHWADGPSLRCLHYLAQRARELPIVLLLTRRPTEPGAGSELLRRIAVARVIRLAALPEAATASLVRRQFEGDGDDEFCRACHAATGGNPFLLNELVAALRMEGVAPTRAQVHRVERIAPAEISRHVLVRLDRLGSGAVALARAAAVLGTGAPLRTAAALAEVDPTTAAEIADGLARADIAAGVQPLEFVHPVVREVIYADIPPGERALAHARAARALAQAGAPAEETAVHLLAAEPAALTWAAEALADAAGEALRRGDPGGAAALLERALAEPPSAERILELERALGRAKALAGDPDAYEHLRSALQAALPGTVRAEIATELAHALVPVGRFEDAVETLEAAVEQLGDADREMALQLEAEISMAGRLHPSTHSRTAKRVEQVAAGIAGETPAERVVLASVASERAMEGRAASAVIETVARVWERGLLRELTSASPMLYDAVFAAVVAEAYPLAERICDETVADARSRGSLLGITGGLCFRARLALRRGAIAAAEADARAAVEAAAIGGYAFAPKALGVLLDALRERGEQEAPVAALEERDCAAELPEDIMATFLLEARARLWISRGEIERGIADLRELERRAEAMGTRNPGVFPWRSDLALALIARGEVAQAGSLAADELVLARRWGTPRPIGVALRVLGVAEGGQDGLAHLREAVAVLEGSKARLEQARALIALGSALRRDGQRAAARAPLRRALDLAVRCGATGLAERARAELLATGARPRRVVLTGVDALTPSELRVAQLAAEGLSNREIAQSLFVSKRTVEVHLTRVYQKLEIAGREELGATLTGRRHQTGAPARPLGE
jgi:DNA-binding CsgD family transcriptional regulator/tetratricopeptide (TPR) repeat protein